ncbi:MAG: non-canonical purine NTP pyrophosphatase, RdgB/HAM1 family [Candidatus Thorarchaeota archaeon]|nr:MAG: non-canonical purine NTP pyrophosphatase, RdgB/HAM1 family [Candidatus Thorarchaeota archaeon]
MIVVTGNPHKLLEIRPLFEKHGIRIEVSQVDKMEVKSDDVVVVAREAAKAAYRVLKRPLVIDDTGLYISALSGFPGAYASFVQKTIGNLGILKLMEGITDRTANFVTAAAYADGKNIEAFVGEMPGRIALAPSGREGFGYDPIFICDGEMRTYAEMSFSEKVAVSHRTKAFASLLDWYDRVR